MYENVYCHCYEFCTCISEFFSLPTILEQKKKNGCVYWITVYPRSICLFVAEPRGMATLVERAHTNVELLICGVKTKLGKCCLFRGDYKSNIKFLASQFVCFGNKYLTVARIDAPQRICPHWLIGRTVARLSMIVFEIERWESRVGGGFPSGNQFVWFGPSAAFA